jgi:pSer/pThr/pTyr-binding forkhead associated (FHA) protein
MIGRADSCNLVIDSPTVSRRHAELRLYNGDWLLSDLGSANGTWVNGWRVDQVVLRPGDEVRLGEFTATFG